VLVAAPAIAAFVWLASPVTPLSGPPLTEERLGNGMRLILAPDPSIPGVAVSLWFGVGSAAEPPGRTGLAHLIEHLMFMGSANVPYPMFDALMERHGGQNNATTTSDTTRYVEWGPAHLLPLFLWMEADRLATLPASLTAEKVTAQRKVVQNERRQSVENQPHGAVDELLRAALFPPSHPCHWPVIGSHADLEAADLADVRRFFAAHYHPANASLAIAGDFRPGEARRWVADHFGWMPGGTAPTPPALPAVEPLRGERRITARDAVTLPLAIIAWRSPRAFDTGDVELRLAARVLGQGRTSRLYKELIYGRPIASEIDAEQASLELAGFFTMSATAAAPQQDPEALKRAMDAVSERFAREGPTGAELEMARTQILTELARTLEPLAGRAELLNQLARELGSAAALPALVERYARATPASVREAFAGMRGEGRVFLEVLPREKR
jgi:predicted Zn-dependent peptidase